MYTYVPPPEHDMFKTASSTFYEEFFVDELIKEAIGWGTVKGVGSFLGRQLHRPARKILGKGYRGTNLAKRQDLELATRKMERSRSKAMAAQKAKDRSAKLEKMKGEKARLKKYEKSEKERIKHQKHIDKQHAKKQEAEGLDEALRSVQKEQSKIDAGDLRTVPRGEKVRVNKQQKQPVQKTAPEPTATTPPKSPATKPETEVPAPATAAPAATKAPTEVPEVPKPPTESPKIAPSGGTSPPSGSTNPPGLPDTPEVPGLWNQAKGFAKTHPLATTGVAAGLGGMYLGSRQKQQPAPTTATMMMR